MGNQQEWFTVNEAADYLRVSRRTIYKLVQEDRLKAYRVGAERHLRFRREDLDAALTPVDPSEAEQEGKEAA